MVKQIGLRLPDDLHDQVKEAADRDRRSIHSEVLWLIEQALAQRVEREEQS